MTWPPQYKCWQGKHGEQWAKYSTSNKMILQLKSYSNRVLGAKKINITNWLAAWQESVRGPRLRDKFPVGLVWQSPCITCNKRPDEYTWNVRWVYYNSMGRELMWYNAELLKIRGKHCIGNSQCFKKLYTKDTRKNEDELPRLTGGRNAQYKNIRWQASQYSSLWHWPRPRPVHMQ